MTLMTYATARDAIYGVFYNVWNTDSASVFGYKPDVRYMGVEQKTKPDVTKAWIHVERFIENTRQSGFRRSQRRRFTTIGTLVIDIYVPRSASQAMDKAENFGDQIRRAYERERSDGVWYRNVTASPGAQTDTFVLVRVMADFEYTEEGVPDA